MGIEILFFLILKCVIERWLDRKFIIVLDISYVIFIFGIVEKLKLLNI